VLFEKKWIVMPGLVPGIHVFLRVKAWMARTSPAMTTVSALALRRVDQHQFGIFQRGDR